MVHQLILATANDDGMNMPRGLLCAGSATEDHDQTSGDYNSIQYYLSSLNHYLFTINNVKSLL